MNKILTVLVASALSFPFISFSTMADESLNADIASIQHQWAVANYSTPENAQAASFEKLIDTAHQITEKHQNAPEALIWEGISNAGYAKAKGGIGALKFAEKARDLFLAAEKANPKALQGSAYTSLGSLFYKVPAWPIGFGSNKKAKVYLEKALEINPNGIDPNYFYADFLLERGEYAKAVEYFEKAFAAPARLGREDADAGRRADIKVGLENAKKHL
jgi:tetratricopeptide (TPR) repeat protein